MNTISCPKCGSVHPANENIDPEDSFDLTCHSCGTEFVGTVSGGALDVNSAEGRTMRNMMKYSGMDAVSWQEQIPLDKPAAQRKGKTDWVALLIGVLVGVPLSFVISGRNDSVLLRSIVSGSLTLILFVLVAVIRAKLGFGPNAGNFPAKRDRR
jgi:hypothetical protein